MPSSDGDAKSVGDGRSLNNYNRIARENHNAYETPKEAGPRPLDSSTKQHRAYDRFVARCGHPRNIFRHGDYIFKTGLFFLLRYDKNFYRGPR